MCDFIKSLASAANTSTSSNYFYLEDAEYDLSNGGEELVIEKRNILIRGKNNPLILANYIKFINCSVDIFGVKFICPIKFEKCKNFIIKDCTFNETGEDSIELLIDSCEKVTIDECTFIDGLYCPLFISDSLNISIQRCCFHKTGICSDNSDAKFGNCIFSNIKDISMIIDCGKVEISNCTFKNINDISILTKSAQFIIENNKFNNCGPGIYNDANSIGTIRNNVMEEIHKGAILAKIKSKISIYDNYMNDIGKGCIFKHSSSIEMHNNCISNVRKDGISSNNKCELVLENNKIDVVGRYGISIDEPMKAKILKCTISNVEEFGIFVAESKETTTINQAILINCKIASVAAYCLSNVEVLNSNIICCNQFAFLSSGSSYIFAKDNSLRKIEKAFVKFEFNGYGSFINNNIICCQTRDVGLLIDKTIFNSNSTFEDTPQLGFQLNCRKKANNKTNVINVCYKCKKLLPLVYASCGHKYLCQNCAERSLRGYSKTTCPFCRKIVKNYSKEYDASDEGTCSICYDNKVANLIIMPCGHTGFCEECISTWFNNHEECPVCRTANASIKEVKKCYF